MRKAVVAVVLVAVVAGAARWWAVRSRRGMAPRGMVYSPQGYGGFVPAKPAPAPRDTEGNGRWGPELQPALEAYDKGKWTDAEAAAAQVTARKEQKPAPEAKRQTARAWWVLAFSAARRHDMKLARDRFATLRAEAASIPDRGKEKAPIWTVAPTLEAEGAYQHAVCTSALGDKAKAEQEYVDFMRRYPDSPLVHAAVQRIGRLHGGDVPKDAEAVWKQAMVEARKREQARQREQSLCAPECLAELLRRRGAPEDVHALAKEMGTSHEGTSLADLAEACRKRGYTARGLMLTPAGLAKQRLPVVAVVAPGHYVLVEVVRTDGVVVWDADANGPGKAARRTYDAKSWGRAWHGVVLGLQSPTGSAP